MYGMSSQEYPVNARVSPFLVLHFSYYIYINNHPDIAIYANETILYSKCDQASDRW